MKCYITITWKIVKTQILGLDPQNLCFTRLVSEMRMSISNKSPGDMNGKGLGIKLENQDLMKNEAA